MKSKNKKNSNYTSKYRDSKTNKTNKNNKKKQKRLRVYTKKDYCSGDGMLTRVWGPSLWHYLHIMSFNYPVYPTATDKKYYFIFLKNLIYVLPCKYCRMNLVNNFKKLPLRQIDMKNRDSFSRYVYNLHELINKMLKKKSGLTYCDVRERYENFRARCTDKTNTTKRNKGKNKKENGCTESKYGYKSKCVIKIVPEQQKCKTLHIDSKCIKKQ